eukprot:5859548-Lingulodinium_polyedra.AAC.1
MNPSTRNIAHQTWNHAPCVIRRATYVARSTLYNAQHTSNCIQHTSRHATPRRAVTGAQRPTRPPAAAAFEHTQPCHIIQNWDNAGWPNQT